MYRRMTTLFQIGLIALLPAGAAFAQNSGASGVVPPTTGAMPSDDTRTPAQEKANKLDQASPALPGDSARPGELPMSDTTTVEKKTVKRKHVKKTTTPSIGDVDNPTNADRKSDVNGIPDDTMNHKPDSKGDLGKDQFDSDK